MRRSSFLALLVLTPVAGLADPFAVASYGASARYRSSSSRLLRNGHLVATLRGPRLAAKAALICNAGERFVAAHGSRAVSGRYTAHGRTILRSGVRVGRATTVGTAAATVRFLNFGEAEAPTLLPAAPTDVRVVRGANGSATVSFRAPVHRPGADITHYIVTATRSAG